MGDTEFPFGNDLIESGDWVGTIGAKSTRWLIAYEGSLAFDSASRGGLLPRSEIDAPCPPV